MNIRNGLVYKAIFGTDLTALDLGFKGTYDASGNVAPVSASLGDYYVISNGGTFDGITYNPNDFAWYDGTVWSKTPALTTGVTLVNGQAGNIVLDTDDITEGSNKYVTSLDLIKLANLPNDTIAELADRFDKTADDSDDIIEGLNNLFLTTAERAKISNTPADTNTELASKFDLVGNTLDDVQNGANFVKSENNFTDEYRTKLDGLDSSFKGSYVDEAALISAYPTGQAGWYAINENTDSIWVWSVNSTSWVDTGSTATGDMNKIFYDPSNKAVDAFDMDNMDDGTSKVAMTPTERTKLSNIGVGDTLTVTAQEKSDIATIPDKLNTSDLANVLYLNSDDSNTIDVQYNSAEDNLEFDVRYQDTDTVLISEDSSGLKANVVDNSSMQKVGVLRNTSKIGDRKEINIIEGTNVSLAVTDNAVEDRIDVVINSTAVAGTISTSLDDTKIVDSATDISFDSNDFLVEQDGTDPNKARISFTGSTSDELVKVTPSDTTGGYLEDKIVSGGNLNVAVQNEGSDESIVLSIPVFPTVSDANLASGDVGFYIYVAERKTIYEYNQDAETADGFFVLETMDGGTSRWSGIAGKYANIDMEIKGSTIVYGDLSVFGTTTTINSQDLEIEDKNIVIGRVETPSDTTADGGGITLKGDTDKTITWYSTPQAWTSSENLDLQAGKKYMIDGMDIFDSLFELSSNSLDDIDDGVTYGKLELTAISSLTSGVDTTLHFHDSDRDRSNHTGTQTASTISDFHTVVSENTDVVNSFDKTADTMDDISDGDTYKKTENNYTDEEKAKLDGIETRITDTFDTGTFLMASFSSSVHSGAILKYSIKNGANIRTGSLYIATDGTDVNITDVSVDLGDTSSVEFSADLNVDDVEISAVSSTSGWTIGYKIEKL